jgi:hypothetical protein
MTIAPANPFALDTPLAAAAGMATPSPAAAPATPAADPWSAPAGDDPFSGPAPQQARGPRLRDLYGRLLLIIPFKVETVPNRLAKDGSTQDRMTADVIVLDGGTIHFGGAPEKIPAVPHTKVAEPPHKSDRMFVSSVGLISQCREALAKRAQGQPGMVLGRLAVGEAKGDQAPPYLLTPPTDADKVLARQYLAKVDPFA